MRRWLDKSDVALLEWARGSHLRFWQLLKVGNRYAIWLVREDRTK